MAIETIYIARHGYRSNWLPEPHKPNPTGIDSDPALAPHGVEQAKELSKYISTLPPQERPGFILSSPFYRCVETAQPLSDSLSVKVNIDRGLGEWFSKDRALVPVPANYDTLSKFFHCLNDSSVWDSENTVGVIPNPEGESREELFDRASSFWLKFLLIIEKRCPDLTAIIIFTSAATAIALGMSLLGREGVLDSVDDDGNILHAGACSISKYSRDQGKWVLKANGNTDFLTNGEEMNWDFHSKFEAGSDEDIKSRLAAKKQREQKKQAEELSETKPQESAGPEDYEDFYVTIDIPMSGKNQNFEDSTGQEGPAKLQQIAPSAQFQITDINNQNPLMKISNSYLTLEQESSSESSGLGAIDGNILMASWKPLVGTDLVFDDNGKFIGTVHEHLVCDENVKFSPRDDQTSDLKEEIDGSMKAHREVKTEFWKKAMAYAKDKSNTKDETELNN